MYLSNYCQNIKVILTETGSRSMIRSLRHGSFYNYRLKGCFSICLEQLFFEDGSISPKDWFTWVNVNKTTRQRYGTQRADCACQERTISAQLQLNAGTVCLGCETTIEHRKQKVN